MLADNAETRKIELAKPITTEPMDQTIAAEAQVLYRNPGKSDKETEQREAALDEELLKDDDDEQNDEV